MVVRTRGNLRNIRDVARVEVAQVAMETHHRDVFDTELLYIALGQLILLY